MLALLSLHAASHMLGMCNWWKLLKIGIEEIASIIIVVWMDS